MKLFLKGKTTQIYIIISFLLLIILTNLPLFQRYMILGDDLRYHILRIESIKDSILAGNYFALIHETVFEGFGYGSGIFYPNFYLYFPAFLRILGFNMTEAYKIFMVAISLMTCITTYFSIKYISKSKYASWIGTILFVSCHYRLINIFDRASLGEFLAMIFFPLIVCGIYDVLYCDFKKPWVLGIGFAGILLAHPISSLLAFLITFTIFCFHIKYFVNHHFVIVKLAITAFVVFLATAFVTLPVIEMMSEMTLMAHTPWTKVSENTLNVIEIFLYTGWFRNICIGIPLALLSFFVVLYRKKQNFKGFNFSDKCFLIGWMLCLAITPTFIWQLLDSTILNAIQFPWRLLGFASIFLSISLGIYFEEIIILKHRKQATIFLLVVVTGFTFILIEKRCDFTRYLADYLEDRHYISQAEWLPIETDRTVLEKSSLLAIDDKGDTITVDKKGTEVKFRLDTKDTYIDSPLLYYKGYSAILKTKEGDIIQLETEHSSRNNLVRVLNPLAEEGNVTVFYEGTLIQKISYSVSFLTILSLFLIHLKLLKKKTALQIKIRK